MSRKLGYTIVVLLLIVAGVSIGVNIVNSQTTPVTTTEMSRFLMDTLVDIRAVGIDSELAAENAFAEMERIEQKFSRHLPESEIAKINSAAGDWVTVSKESLDLISTAIKYGEISSGAFDITLGGVIDLWGFTTPNKQVPAPEVITKALESVNYAAIEVDYKQSQIRIPTTTILDLGGIAKGYAIDRGAAVLREHGIKHAMVYAGGDIVLIGNKQDGSQWRVGLQHPRESDLVAVVPVTDRSIVTSGDYQRYFMQDDVRYHHILDPQTGFPATGLASVTIVARSAVDADSLSTAVFVLGIEKGLALVESLEHVEAVLITADGSIYVSSGLQESFQEL